MYCGAVAPNVRRNRPSAAIRSPFDNLHGVTADDFVDAEPGQCDVGRTGEDGPVWRTRGAFGHKLFEHHGRFLPERADPPFVPFPMQMDARARIEKNIVCPKVRRLLYTGSGVVKEEQESSVTQSMTSVDR